MKIASNAAVAGSPVKKRPSVGKIPAADLGFLLRTDNVRKEKGMIHIIGGAVAAILGLIGIIGWWDNFGDFLRGCMPLVLLIAGLIAVNTGLRLKKKTLHHGNSKEK